MDRYRQLSKVARIGVWAGIVVVALVVIGALGGGKSDTESATSTTSAVVTTTTTATTTSAPSPTLPDGFEDTLRQFALDRADLIVGVQLDPAGTLQIATTLYRDAEAGPPGMGMCITAQDAGWEGEIQVLGTDGGVIASTRQGLCGIRV